MPFYIKIVSKNIKLSTKWNPLSFEYLITCTNSCLVKKKVNVRTDKNNSQTTTESDSLKELVFFHETSFFNKKIK